MKLGKPVTETSIPISRRGSGRFREIWTAVQSLKNGEWLPVLCTDEKEATDLIACGRGHRGLDLALRKRGLTVYVRCLPRRSPPDA